MKQALHPDLMRTLNGELDLLTEIDRLSARLADIMTKIHGGKWTKSVNHNEGCFVIVARDFSEDGNG